MSADAPNGVLCFQCSSDSQNVFAATGVSPPLLEVCEEPPWPFKTNGLHYREVRRSHFGLQLLGPMEFCRCEVLHLVGDVLMDTRGQVAVYDGTKRGIREVVPRQTVECRSKTRDEGSKQQAA